MQPADDIAQRVVAALARPRWMPADPVLLGMLAQRNAETSRSVVRLGMWAAVFSYIAYGIFDWFLFPDVAARLISIRIALGLTFLALIEFSVLRGFTLATLHKVAATAIAFGAVGWLIFALSTEYQQALAAFIVFGTVFVLGANLYFNFRLWLSACTSSFVAGAYVAAIVGVLDVAVFYKIVLSFYFINSLVLSLYLSWWLGVERYRAYLHSLRAQFQEQAAIEKGQKLNEMANTDPLTGLRNRRAIAQEFSILSKEWATDDEEIGLILIDVDFFKRFNDRLGHQSGDDCLIQLANAFAETASSHGGIAARYGGEEFVILCRVADSEQLAAIAWSYCQAVERIQIVHPDRGDSRGIVTISAGASLTRPDHNLDFRLLLQEADRALYTSKFSGRAMSTVYDPLTIYEERSSENLAELLSTAIVERRLSVVYQPIFEAASERLMGHETLMRFRDREGRAISPAVFIPVAEHTGSIVELGAWVVEQACSDVRRHGLGPVVAVNISAVQLKAPNFSLVVAEILGRYEIAPNRLALEFTEGMEIVPDAVALRNIEHLRNLGVQVWLDDFGTGFASLAWLRRFDFDVVKIDRSFLHECHTPQGMRMLQDMVRLLRNQGYKVLIEGIETGEQKVLVQRLGVHAMQGYHLGRPEPVGETHADGAEQFEAGDRQRNPREQARRANLTY